MSVVNDIYVDQGFRVAPVSSKATHDFILNKHYAGRLPSISYAYGLYKDPFLVGVLTIGKPASNSLCEGVMGVEHKDKVYELNRLVTEDNLPQNTLSWFVSKVLKMLNKEDLILVSYADSAMGHHGYIYQATNWIYTGETKQRTDKYTPGNKHSRHYSDQFRNLRKVRTAKHRYVYFTNKKRRKEYYGLLKYEVKPYPKGDNKTYVLGDKLRTKVINTDTNETWWE